MLSTQENCLQNFPKKRLVPLISLETLFYVVFEMAWQKTPGKFLTGSFVINSNGVRGKIGFRVALLRTLIRFVPLEGFSFFRGKGGWHDTWTSTRVECSPRSKASLGESVVVGIFVLLSTAFVVILDPALDARAARLDKQKYRSWRASTATYYFENGMNKITKSYLLQFDIPKGNEKDDDRVMLKVENNENGVITAAKMETSGTHYSGVPEYYMLHQEDFPRIKIDTATLKKYVSDGIKEPDGPGFDYLGDGSSYFFFDCDEISSARLDRAVLMPGSKDSVILELQARDEPFRMLAIEEVGKNKRRRAFPKTALYNNFEQSEGKQDRSSIRFNLSKNTLSDIGDTIVLVLEDATGEARIHLIRLDSSDQLQIRSQRELD